METEYITILITTPSAEVAQKIAHLLLERKLAACANLVAPVHSIYTWEGKLHEDEEVLMLVKTRADLFNDELIGAVKSIHPYQVPEIIALPILAGSESYLDWIGAVTK